jgi:hypothetical protein
MTGTPAVTEPRLVVAAPDHAQPLAFYRDVPALPERAAHEPPGGRVTIPEAGRHPRTRRPAAPGRHRSGREAIWDSPRGVGWPCALGAVMTHARGGVFRSISFPVAYLGAFAGVFRARGSPRRSPSYRLKTLIAGIESMGVRAAPVGRAPGTRLVPAQPGYPGNGNRRCPARRSS